MFSIERLVTQKKRHVLPLDALHEVLSTEETSIWKVIGIPKTKPEIQQNTNSNNDVNSQNSQLDISPDINVLVDFVRKQTARQLNDWLALYPDTVLNTRKSNTEILGDFERIGSTALSECPPSFRIVARNIEDQVWLERGAYGQTILHHALLLKMEKLLEFLLSYGEYDEDNVGGKKGFNRLNVMINTVYEKAPYWGEHACHLAVVRYGDKLEKLRLLIERGADVHLPRARGFFFGTDDDVNSIYMGGTVLAFAAVMGHQKIVDYLVNVIQVDPSTTDYHGNNVLHVLAWHGLLGDSQPTNSDENSNTDVSDNLEKSNEESTIVKGKIYYQLQTGIRNPEISMVVDKSKKADDSDVNLDGMTPFIVSVNRNQVQMVQAILKHKSHILWKYGRADKERYELTEVDTFTDPKIMNQTQGALSIAVQNASIDILKLPVFNALLQSKWISYGKRIFQFRFYTIFLHLVFFFIALYLTPNDQQYFLYSDSWSNSRLYNYERPQNASDIFRCIFEVFVLVYNMLVLFQFAKEFRSSILNYSAKYVLKSLAFVWNHDMLKYANLLIFIVIVILRLLRFIVVENVFLMIYALIGWSQLMNYYRGFKDVGPLSIALVNIVTFDVANFLGILLVVLLGFGSALWLQMAPFGSLNAETTFNGTYPGLSNPDDADWANLIPGGLIVWSVKLFFTSGVSYDDFRNGTSQYFAILLYMLFFFAVNIILLNVFIAMINNTFGKVLNQSEDEFLLSWASLIIEIDDIINTKHMAKVELTRNLTTIIPSPITRIGIPRRAPFVNPTEQKKFEKQVESNNKATEKKGVFSSLFEKKRESRQLDAQSSVPTAQSFKARQESSPYFVYDLYLEFHGGNPNPKHITSTVDPTSPHSEAAREERGNAIQAIDLATRRMIVSNSFH
ncbi:Transient receptor putative cation channel sub V member 3 [Physocladia obscura]|uniref:Transient receptor putative cation channel sub V member 3 n=1 Tax=Physocladia obscura TaxID=109957 RepID=A0AAD5SWR5_9FUNG|nr:Transient receptor putative cation channel sub V member 3 [Physocladia obscura]